MVSICVIKNKGGISINNTYFGIEIELTGYTREQVALILSKTLGNGTISINDIFKDNHGFKFLDVQLREWKIACDKSISAINNDYKVEIISPKLTMKDFGIITTICDSLPGAVVNESTGLHIHIDTLKHSPWSLLNFYKIMQSIEANLYEIIDVHIERKQKYCKPYDVELMQWIGLIYIDNMKTLENHIYSKFPKDDRAVKKHPLRYYGFNWHSIFRNGTIELRYFNSTLNPQLIKQYILFVLAINNYCLINVNNNFTDFLEILRI